MPRPTLDISGRSFGDLTALRVTTERQHRYAVWECRCACGNTALVSTQALANGRSNCGCRRRSGRERQALPEHGVWKSMIKRCRNPVFQRYAGRGITVCERWQNFAAFFADMGPRPSPKHSIERIDNDGNYEPSNCRWATETEQKRNFSRNRILTFNGESMPLIAWAERAGLSEKTLRHRIERNWPIERALTRPQQTRKPHAATT